MFLPISLCHLSQFWTEQCRLLYLGCDICSSILFTIPKYLQHNGTLSGCTNTTTPVWIPYYLHCIVKIQFWKEPWKTDEKLTVPIRTRIVGKKASTLITWPPPQPNSMADPMGCSMVKNYIIYDSRVIQSGNFLISTSLFTVIEHL